MLEIYDIDDVVMSSHVSIFNLKWLLADKAFMANKKPKTTTCQTDTVQYPGSIPNQVNHPLAPRLLAHKEIVLQMQID